MLKLDLSVSCIPTILLEFLTESATSLTLLELTSYLFLLISNSAGAKYSILIPIVASFQSVRNLWVPGIVE